MVANHRTARFAGHHGLAVNADGLPAGRALPEDVDRPSLRPDDTGDPGTGVGCFYTPYGLTSFGTAIVCTRYALFKFLYALRRDLLWNRHQLVPQLFNFGYTFLYALRRDLRWNDLD